MPSVRDTAERFGATGTISVVHDLFKHLNGVPAGRTISVRSHITGLEGPRIKVNMILISPETFTGTDIDNLDVALADLRRVYEAVELGVDVDHLWFDGDDAEEFRVIIREGRARKLLRRVRGPGNDNLDVSFVPVWDIPNFADGVVDYYSADEVPEDEGPFHLDRFGYTPGEQKARRREPSMCRPKSRAGQKGAAVGMNFASFGLVDDGLDISPLGLLLAHHVGHLLGLGDYTDEQNVMYWQPTGFELSAGQRDRIFSSCAIQ